MSPTLRTGLLIGVLCVIWTFVMGFTGWYKDPAMLFAFFLVIIIEVVLLVVGLRQTAAQNTYGRQVIAGTTMSIIAAVIIFFGSLLFTTVAFPSYFDDLKAGYTAMLTAQGKPAADAEAEAQKTLGGQTSLGNALQGVAGTIGTGLIASLIIAAFARKK